MRKDWKLSAEKNRFKKMAIKTITFMLIISVILTGCGGGKKNDEDGKAGGEHKDVDIVEKDADIDGRYMLDPDTPAWKLDNKESTELTWYVNADWWNTDYGNDTVTKKLKEDLRLDIEFLSGDDTKLNTYFAGEEMPDIITIFDGNSPTALKADSWAVPLNDLADKYDPYFYKVASEQTMAWYQLDDGKTYGYPSYSNTQEDYDNILVGTEAFVIREDIYKVLGEPNMSTPDDFLEVLNQIKEKHPEVVPFGFNNFGEDGNVGSLGDTLQNMLGVPIETEEGEFYNRNLDEEYLKWIKTLNEAYKAGCISDDSISDDATTFEEKVASGQYGCMLINGVPQLSGVLQRNIASNPKGKYVAIDGPQSSLGNPPTLSQAGISGWSVTYITKTCSDPAKAIQLFTYLLSDEGQYLTTFGVEGETFEFNEDGKAVLKDEVKQLRNEENDEFKKRYRLGEFWFFGHDSFSVLHGENEPIESIAQIQEWTKGKLKPQFVIENIDPSPGTMEARNLSNINTYWASTLANLITAKDDATFDNVLEDYKEFLNQNGFDEIVDIRNENMDKNREKLGMQE